MMSAKYRWVQREMRLHLLEASDGEVVDTLKGDFSNDTWSVGSLDKSYTSIEAAKIAAVKNYLRILEGSTDNAKKTKRSK